MWDGVYTEAQAARGKATYQTYCMECHEEDLHGGRGRPLAGPVFWRDWGEDNLDGIFNLMRVAMPRDNPASLTDNQYVDVVSYILQVNGLPSGPEELTPEATHHIRVFGKDGPGPVPEFAMVQVVGCLGRDAHQAWKVTNAAAPSRIRDPKPLTDTTPFRDRALGATTFRLMSPNTPLLVPHEGHKVLVKGLLVRAQNEERLNFLSVTMLDAACQPQQP